jgi:hypothetical protein
MAARDSVQHLISGIATFTDRVFRCFLRARGSRSDGVIQQEHSSAVVAALTANVAIAELALDSENLVVALDCSVSV